MCLTTCVCCPSKAVANEPSEGTTEDIELLKDESGGLMWEEGITTITFYKGDFNSAAAALKAQFAQVLGANSWLAGRLVKTKAGVRLRHPLDPVASGAMETLFTATPAGTQGAGFKLTPTSSYIAMCTEMYRSKNVVVGSGRATLGKDKPLALLTLVESTPGEFGLIFSLSHAVADGRTYYDVCNMLQPGAAVRSLTTLRVLSFSEAMRDKCGRKEMKWIESSSTAFLYTFATLPAMLGCKKAKCFAFLLDDAKLAAAKSAAAESGGVPYVTTNDILTSGFFNVCRSRIGLMGLDCRGKLSGIVDDLAGNYVTALVLDKQVYGTPATLRKMYAAQPYVTTKARLPGWWGDGRFAMITNWSSFAGSLIALDGCEMRLHLPVQNPANCVFDLMIPFASGPAGKGVLCWTVTADEEQLREALPLGQGVSSSLFP